MHILVTRDSEKALLLIALIKRTEPDAYARRFAMQTFLQILVIIGLMIFSLSGVAISQQSELEEATFFVS